MLGGILGGALGAEIGKKAVGWKLPTGDAWVPALAVGLVIGRIGCQLSGTWDQTYGIPTELPWTWDYGDGMGRHPTALYEILLVTVAFLVTRIGVISRAQGASFALFVVLYCVIRLGLEFLKPPFGAAAVGTLPVALQGGLTAIQWAAVLGMVWFTSLLAIRIKDRGVR